MVEQKIAKSIGAIISLNKIKVITLLNKHGANLDYSTPTKKVYKTVKGFGSSNQKFAKELIDLIVSKGYLKKSDLQKSSITGSYFNLDPATMGLITGAVGKVGQGVGDFLKKPEVDSEVLNTILEIEQKKSEDRNRNLAKYWVAGGIAFGLLAITGIIIYKKS
tara:strand:- start:411 stop:899 length:489 start_codon:yes stop_codon:yes gene_type:complete